MKNEPKKLCCCTCKNNINYECTKTTECDEPFKKEDDEYRKNHKPQTSGLNKGHTKYHC